MISRPLQVALRTGFAALLGAVFAAVLASPAAAHAGLSSSDPAEGAMLDAAPASVTMSFTEPPDADLSTVAVLDSTGAELDTPPAERGAPPRSLTVALPAGLGDGVYTVSWRVVSEADGHLTVGVFTFGVGVDPGHAAAPGSHVPEPAPQASPLAIAGKTLLYAGLVPAVGAAVVGLGAFSGTVPGRRLLLPVAGALALVGAIAMVFAEADSIGASLGDLLRSGAGRPYIWLVATAAITLVLGVVASRSASIWPLALMGLSAAAAMLVRATSGHAAGLSPPLPAELAQFVHFVAVGIWIGGVLLLVILLWSRRAKTATDADGSTTPEEQEAPDVATIGAAAASRRAHDLWGYPHGDGPRLAEISAYSRIAGWAVLVVVLTGLWRTVGEAGGIDDVGSVLTDTTYGTTLLIKVAVALAIIALGAFNRWRSIPRMETGGTLLRRIVAVEVVAALGVFGLTAALTGFDPGLPGEHMAEETAPPSISASGSDFATTTRVELTVTPGTPGDNTFEAHVVDFDTGAPIEADEVVVHLAPLGRLDVEHTVLTLEQTPDGTWTASGTQLSLPGAWDALVEVGVEARTTEVPLTLITRAEPVEPVVARQEGLPDVATFRLPTGEQLQVYVDPGTTGDNELHVTAFDAAGTELPLSSMVVVASMPDGELERLDAVRLTPGHFSSPVELMPGPWRFDVVGTTEQGGVLQVGYEYGVAA